MPQQMLVQCAIDHWGEDCRDVTTTKLQCHVYKEWKYIYKKRNKKSGGGVRGGCVQRMEAIVKRKNKFEGFGGRGGGVSR